MFCPRGRQSLVVCLSILLLVPAAATAAGSGTERILIRGSKPYSGLVARIARLGGKVTRQFKYVDAVAAEVPSAALAALKAELGEAAITKDLLVPAPAPVDTTRGRPGFLAGAGSNDHAYDGVEAIGEADLAGFAAEHPNAYLINNSIMNVDPFHAGGIAGEGIVVGVIDSGIRPGFPHLDLDGSVIGCEDFVGDGLGCSNFANGGHGTFVAGMISANVVFSFDPASALRNSVLEHCPSCFIDPPTNTMIPMIGTAPLSSIYALRVFPPVGGASTSTILAAVERAIELKEKFDAGEPDGVNIQVVNMSLGGPTLVSGFDLFDIEVGVMLLKGIVPVVAAGNAGPSSLTMGSPGSSFGVVTVGAAGHAHNERILRDLQFGLGIGSLYRPFDGTQSAFFSSRGPNADGHVDPDVTANGFASFGQGFSSTTLGITIGSGTSFATPSVAGIAALLRQAFPGAHPLKIRNAIIAGANPSILQDGSINVDQGHGFVDALAAGLRLLKGNVPLLTDRFRIPTGSVARNVERNTSLDVRHGSVNVSASSLLPGQREDILYEVGPKTRQVMITIADFVAELPPAEQNQLFGDDLLLAIHSAKTSSIGEGDYLEFTFTTGGVFIIDDPEPGLLRITVNGDWTNAGRVSASVSVASTEIPLLGLTNAGKIRTGDVFTFPISVPAGVTEAEFRLSWKDDWGSYPTSDLDMVLVSPSSVVNQDGATLDSPEVVTVATPEAGTWLVHVIGFEIPAKKDFFKLRVALDGNVVN